MKSALGRTAAPCCILMLFLCACDWLAVYDAQISKASHAIEIAKNDAERAAAFAERGRGYSDKARLSIARKVIDRDEYLRLFALAIKDHDQAVALAPGDAEVRFKRGLSYYDRAAWVSDVDVEHEPWFDSARSDFAAAVEKNPRHASAYDYLGMVDEQTGRFDMAIVDFTREMELDRRTGRMRLADLHCNRGQSYLKENAYDLAAADFEKSIEFGASNDGCSCEPYNPLAYIYIDVERQFDKAWDLVNRSPRARRTIASEYVERLKKASGRNS